MYQSPEFALLPDSIGGAYQRKCVSSAAFFDNKIWVGASSPRFQGFGGPPFSLAIQVMTLPFYDPQQPDKTINIEKGEAADPSNWTQAAISIPGIGLPVSDAAPAFAATSDKLFLVWGQSWGSPAPDGSRINPGIYAAQYSPTGDNPSAWQFAVALLDPNGDPIVPAAYGSEGYLHSSAVAAVPFGDTAVIMGFGHVSNPGDMGLLCTFHIDDIDPKAKTWKASSGATLSAAKNRISLDWFNNGPWGTPGTPSTTGDPVQKPPSFKLWVTYDTSPSNCILELSENGDISKTGLWGFWYTPPGGSVFRDPCGRICLYTVDGKQINRAAFNTFGSMTLDRNVFVQAGDPLSSAPVPPALPPTPYAPTPPAVLYFRDTSNPSPISFNNQPGTAYPVYEFIFHTPDLGMAAGGLYCQINRYGTAEVFPSFGQFTPGPKTKTNLVVGGIVDGPIPLPNPNIAKLVFQDTNPVFATFCYGLGTSHTVDHSVSNSWTFGFKTEGEFTKGFGVAWDISLNGGTGYVQGDSDKTTLQHPLTAGSVPLAKSKATKDPCVDPTGALFGSEIILHWTAFRFRDAAGNLVVDGIGPKSDGTGPAPVPNQAPVFAAVTAIARQGISSFYVPYAVTPGDLDSYKPESINANMNKLLQEAGLVPFEGYGGDYFHEVIEANAYPFKDDQRYLIVSWDNHQGGGQETFEKISTSFTENSWTLNLEAYIGLSGGGGFSCLGVGEDMQWKFLVGGSYSHKATQSTTDENDWSVGLEGLGMNLPEIDITPETKEVNSYGFRIYFLPVPGANSKLPPNYWVKELKQLLPYAPKVEGQPAPADIDEGACAWKVVFVLDNYNLADGTVYP